MGKLVHNDVLDAALNEIATATELYICTAEPTSRANADSISVIAAHTLTGGDFTNADGDTSGRKVTISAQNGLTADAAGTANHIALCDSSDLLYVTTFTGTVVAISDTINVGSWKAELADPS
jgi:hypothetical protein